MIVAENIEAYSEAHTSPPPEHLRALADETRATLDSPQMLTGAVEGRFLETLVWIAQPRLVVELGTYSGYSAQFMARALPPGGRVITCELSPERAAFAQERLREDGVEIRLGPGLDTLATIDEPVDLAFIDADKDGYLGYWREVVPRVRPGGLIMVDNTFSHGRVIDAGNDNPLVIAVRDFNDLAAADDRVDLVMVPIGDGLTLARKRD